MIKRYTMPKGSPASTVTMRELSGRDELEAAKAADALTPQKTVEALTDAERREAVRISLVEIDGKAIDHAVPLFEIDEWPRRARKALEAFFADLNGINRSDVDKCTASAESLSDGAGRFGSRFRLPKGIGLEIEEVEIWELRGIEELEAARAVDATPTTGVISRELARRRAMMSASIKTPLDWSQLRLRTLTMLSFLFEHVNGVPADEILGLVASAVAVDAAPAEAASPHPSMSTPAYSG